MAIKQPYRTIYEAAKARITFFDLNPAGGQKVISGFCFENSCHKEEKQFFKLNKITLNKFFLV
jgi:hypothetical protein